MKKIGEQEFIKILENLKGKTILIKLEGETEAQILLQEMEFKIPYKSNIVKMHDKAKNNKININLALYYKIVANNENNVLKYIVIMYYS